MGKKESAGRYRDNLSEWLFRQSGGRSFLDPPFQFLSLNCTVTYKFEGRRQEVKAASLFRLRRSRVQRSSVLFGIRKKGVLLVLRTRQPRAERRGEKEKERPVADKEEDAAVSTEIDQ